MALAEAWSVAPTAAGLPVPVAAWICLNAAQKLVAGGADVGATVAGAGVGLADVVDVMTRSGVFVLTGRGWLAERHVRWSMR
jgi:hypothetical protein